MNNFITRVLSVRIYATRYASDALRASRSVLSHVYSKTATLQDSLEASATPSLSTKEQVFFIKRLAFLVKANVPLLEGLHMVHEQARSRRHTRIITKVIEDVSNGQSLSRSLGKFPRIFGDFGINIIKVGENSGTLSQNLEYLADELKKRQALKKKVLGAFVYPAVITVATLGITAFLMLYLFPKIMPIFSSLHMELPLSTKIVMAVSIFLQQWGITTLFVLAALVVVGVVVLRKSKIAHFYFDSFLLKVPLLGMMIRQYNLATSLRTIGILLKSGITLSEALPLAADTTQNLVYKKEFRALAETVNRGEQISQYLKKNRVLFPDVMTQMISVGERSGNLSNTLVYLSEFYESEVDDVTKNLSSLIEPGMMVVMGIVVGFVAISIITPIYGITQNLHP